MAESIDIASAVGTWLAAVLALIALFGIIAPFLLWITLRSERHIAHKAIDDPQHLFVSSGIRIWHNTRILRRARVPRLTEVPKLPREFNGQRKDDCLRDPPSKTGWIGFCSALHAFSLAGSKDRTGDLVVEDGQTWLPVHKLWVLVLGLLGRYSDREDQGQAIVERSKNRLDYDIDDDERGVLHGSIGPLQFRTHNESRDPDRLYLAPYNRQLRGSLTPDAISLEYLFWLAAGCLPLGDKVLDLGMVKARFRSRSRERMRQRRWSEVSRSSRSSSESTDSEPANEEAAAAQAGEDPQEATQRRWESKRDSYGEFNFYYLEKMEDILPTAKWTIWANAMGCDMEAVHTIERLEISDTEDIQIIKSILDNVPSKQRHDRLKEKLNERRYTRDVVRDMPREQIQNTTGPWVAVMLLSYDIGEFPPRALLDGYISRVDFQCLALAALLVPVTPRHFLFNFDRGNSVFKILTLARFKQREILHAVKQTLPHWHLDNQAAFEELLQAAENVKGSMTHSRRDTEVLYQLVSHISTITHGSKIFHHAIGLLYLTSHEFRSFIDELARSDAVAEHSSIYVNMPLNQVECVTVNGEQTIWRLEFHAVFPSAMLPPSLPRTRVALKDLMLATLQAWARITWFAQPIDAQPLLEFVDTLSDVVHVAANTKPPPVRQESSHHRSLAPIARGDERKTMSSEERRALEEARAVQYDERPVAPPFSPPQDMHEGFAFSRSSIVTV